MRFKATLAQFNADPTPEAADIPLIKGNSQRKSHNITINVTCLPIIPTFLLNTTCSFQLKKTSEKSSKFPLSRPFTS